MIVLNLQEQHVQVIGDALSNYTYRLSAPVIEELQKQITNQPKDQLVESRKKLS